MPYRALTHGRVGGGRKGFTRNETLPSTTTQSQATAINSAKGVGNNGPVASQRNKNNSSNKQPAQKYARLLSINSLMTPNALGTEAYVTNQGKGFPNALPQTSVGSTNTFSRRAIARRAVTKMAGNKTSENCPCNNQVKNLKGQFLNN